MSHSNRLIEFLLIHIQFVTINIYYIKHAHVHTAHGRHIASNHIIDVCEIVRFYAINL